jgi:hypothetical protein
MDMDMEPRLLLSPRKLAILCIWPVSMVSVDGGRRDIDGAYIVRA